MKDIYLFDWGNTLMVDFPGVPGKMRDWDVVQAVDGAKEALSCLSKKADLYIATGASESTESDIKAAFSRVALDHYITGYFCKANLRIEKGTSDFLMKILTNLSILPEQATMVGDSYDKDIQPALDVGMNAVWLSETSADTMPDNVRVIRSLVELCR